MERNKLCSSNDIVQKSNSSVLVLQLPENDPYFDKKKILLQKGGFDIREQILLESLSSSGSVATTFKKILQIARIIHLDEVELYFSAGDGCSFLEYCSFRNEMDALNSILRNINNMISNNKLETMKILQGLQGTTLDKIRELVKNNKVETIIDKSYNCERERCLVEWGNSEGVKTKLEISCIEGAGRGGIATEDLKVGEVALEIPVSIIIWDELVKNSDMYHTLKNIDGVSSETMMLLWSMKERQNADSKFKLYFDALPMDFNTGLSFGVNAILALDGSMLLSEEIMQAKEHLRVQYDELIPALCNSYPEVFPPELYTWEKFVWACELWYSNSMKVMFADGELRTCLIPVAGFINHSPHPHIVNYGKIDSTTNTLKFPLSRPCGVGEECYLSYGNFSSSHLITFYGFLPKGDNPYDIMPLGKFLHAQRMKERLKISLHKHQQYSSHVDDIDVGETYEIDDCPMSSWTTHMVRGTWLSNNHSLFYYGLPSPLLDHLRSARDPEFQTKHIVSLFKTQSKLETELEVLEDLQSIFSNMLENLGEEDLVDSENASWDVKLALEYMDLQRRIISSIISSCDAGLKLVQNELSKISIHG